MHDPALKEIRFALRSAWQLLRQWSGDDAYDRYLSHMSTCHAHEPPLDRREFFCASMERRWNGINRCC